MRTASPTTGGKDNARSTLENIVGGPQNDLLYGSGAANLLLGGAGRDFLLGGRNCGGCGDDRKADSIFGGDGNVVGSDGGDDILIGNSQPNRLTGYRGNDDLFGLGGDDLLDCGSGSADEANGGAGSDTATGCEAFVSVP